MGAFRCLGRRGLLVLSLMALMLSSCQVVSTPASSQLLRQQRFLDLTGLLPRSDVEALRVNWAAPRDWEALPLKRGGIYTHQQYRSQTGITGVGVAYIRMPIPLPAASIAWFAKNEYLKKARDQKEGQLLGRWTDPAGREWFEAENNKYHVRGYVLTRGLDAWLVYSGYRTNAPAEPQEINIANRSAQTISPCQ